MEDINRYGTTTYFLFWESLEFAELENQLKYKEAVDDFLMSVLKINSAEEKKNIH